MYMREYAYIYISCKRIAPSLFFPHFTVDGEKLAWQLIKCMEQRRQKGQK